MSKMTKTVGAVFGATALIASGTAAVAPVVDGSPLAPIEGYAAEVSAPESAATAIPVTGQFAYSQDVVTDMGVFTKAATALCASLPQYSAAVISENILLTCGDTQLSATVEELAKDGKVDARMLACACSSNIAGGGAIANAEVGGVTLEALVQMMAA